jgi:hypothetical protein
MDRAFFPGGGFGGRRFFRPFPHPFFPGRFLYPYFFFSPFFFPFVRDGQAGDSLFAAHQAQPGQTLGAVAHQYNIPQSILEEANPHLTNPNQLSHGDTVYIPRISNLGCHKGYAEMPGQTQNAGTMMYQGQHS